MASAHVDPELGLASARSASLPPDWIDKVTEIQYDFTKIKEKSKLIKWYLRICVPSLLFQTSLVHLN